MWLSDPQAIWLPPSPHILLLSLQHIDHRQENYVISFRFPQKQFVIDTGLVCCQQKVRFITG